VRLLGLEDCHDWANSGENKSAYWSGPRKGFWAKRREDGIGLRNLIDLEFELKELDSSKIDLNILKLNLNWIQIKINFN
jgi:hypothetical protein